VLMVCVFVCEKNYYRWPQSSIPWGLHWTGTGEPVYSTTRSWIACQKRRRQHWPADRHVGMVLLLAEVCVLLNALITVWRWFCHKSVTDDCKTSFHFLVTPRLSDEDWKQRKRWYVPYVLMQISCIACVICLL